MTRKVTVIGAALTVLLTAWAASGEYYQYRAKDGSVVLTDNTVKGKGNKGRVVTDAELERKEMETRDKAYRMPAGSDTGSAAQVSASAPAAPQKAAPAPPSTNPWVKGGIILAIAAGGFFLVRFLCSRLSSPQLARVILFGFFMVVFGVVYKSYTDYLVGGYLTIKNKTVQMFTQSVQRTAPEEAKTRNPLKQELEKQTGQ